MRATHETGEGSATNLYRTPGNKKGGKRKSFNMLTNAKNGSHNSSRASEAEKSEAIHREKS